MKKRVGILIFIVLILGLCGCGTKEKTTETEERLDKIIADNNYIIVDVRTEEEYNEGHVQGAVLIPYDEIDEKVSLDKNKTILVYCRSGRRSNMAYETLKKLGYEVYDLGAYESISLKKVSS